ncbi:MAG: heme A synthase, partial [Ilumatobacteraceae bacterium]
RAAEPDGTDRRTIGVSPTAGRRSWLLAILTAVAILTGTVVTGAGPHAGDEDVERLDVTVGAAARLHGISVIAALLVAVITALVIRRRPGDARTLQGPLSTWIFVGLRQAAVGYTQYFNEVPAGLVAIHVAGATALWVVTVWLVMSTTRPAPIASVDRPLVAAA